MKLQKQRIQRKGSYVKVLGEWTNRWRKPAHVTVSIEGASADGHTVTGEPVTLAGDVKEVFGALAGLAEIAWASGWRPEGFEAHMAKQIREFKVATKLLENAPEKPLQAA